MPPSRTIVFCVIDDLLPITGNPVGGFPDFLDGLADAGIPAVWITSRNRHQLDSTIRKLGHAGPFIAEGGSGVYLPEDYFHLKPPRTVRLGRFTCIPVATQQPAAQQALDLLAEETGVSVVPLRSLSTREAMQNTGLSRHDAEALRQRDFDELFFFAGASEGDIHKFQQRAAHHKFSLRPAGSLWSLALQASLPTCIQELRKLYDRALHARGLAVGVATLAASGLLKACDRTILLTDRASTEPPAAGSQRLPAVRLPLFSADSWPRALEAIQSRRF